jgi:putative FmdB family regulatory protein
MPIYEFACQDCGHEFEKIQSFSDSSTPACPNCLGVHVQRRLSAPAIHFKGSGWYITDSKSAAKGSATGGANAGEGDSPKSESPKGDSKTEGKNETGKSETSKGETGKGDATKSAASGAAKSDAPAAAKAAD